MDAGEKSKIIFDQFANFRLLQMARAATTVQICFYLLSHVAVVFQLSEMRPFRPKRFWKTIFQMKRNELQ
jgi:hypothetical protein